MDFNSNKRSSNTTGLYLFNSFDYPVSYMSHISDADSQSDLALPSNHQGNYIQHEYPPGVSNTIHRSDAPCNYVSEPTLQHISSGVNPLFHSIDRDLGEMQALANLPKSTNAVTSASHASAGQNTYSHPSVVASNFVPPSSTPLLMPQPASAASAAAAAATANSVHPDVYATVRMMAAAVYTCPSAAIGAAPISAMSTPASMASEIPYQPVYRSSPYAANLASMPLVSNMCSGSALSNTSNSSSGISDSGAAMIQPIDGRPTHGQLPYQIYAPAPLMSLNGESMPTAAPAPAAGGAASHCTPIMQSVQQRSGEQLYAHLDYASLSSAAATTAAGGLLPDMAGTAGHGFNASTQIAFGSQGVQSLAHTPQLEQFGYQSPAATLLGGYTMGPATAAATIASAGSTAMSATSSPMITSGFDGISLSGGTNATMSHAPFSGPPAAWNPSQAAYPRIHRSLSSNAQLRARSSSPNHLMLGFSPRSAAPPHMVHAHTTNGAVGYGHGSGSHSRSGSEAFIGRNKRASVHLIESYMSRRKSSIASMVSTPLSRLAKSADRSRAGSAISQNSALSATDDAESAMDNDIESEADGNRDNGVTQSRTVGQGQQVRRIQGLQGGSRIPLTDEQREIFFRWLYENAHDPKPRGHERDRLRHIGNMSRERFKTWFANARRRYFVITQENGVLRYSINQRFLVACQRAKISLD
ncbi:hypothetical protein LPJ53_002449 [Coemansia erecta]|uniref:Homeobox domain-containing protein n=1 Tax=Coemansia erecta TaxID=147472 RepID=A0A9W7Y262_9FUNG|nr:hypothetical protein LPJ53_002449 [Coemansia erecta]